MLFPWKHDDLADDLARHLACESRMVWSNIQLGPVGSPRPDVYTIERSFARPMPTAYEVKISTADFRSDVTSGKWATYRDYAHAIVFAVPAGLIDKASVPEQCGLIVRSSTGWRYAKKATINPHPIAQAALLKLLIDGVTREGPKARAAQWNEPAHAFARAFGSQAAQYVRNAATAHERIAAAEAHAKQIRDHALEEAERIRRRAMDEAPELWHGLTKALGLEPATAVWRVAQAVKDIELKTTGGKDAATLRSLHQELERLVRRYTPTEKETS